MGIKDFNEYSAEEIGLWLIARGHEDAAKFVEEGVDGDLLLSLSADDLKNDLGISCLQKLMKTIEFSKMVGALDEKKGNEVDEKVNALEGKVRALRRTVKSKDREIAELRSKMSGMRVTEKHSPPPDVTDARCLLQDYGEYLAARGQYDPKLVLAKQLPPPLPSSRQTKVLVAPLHQSAATFPSLGIRESSISKGRLDTAKKPHRDGVDPMATKSGVAPVVKPSLKKNLNVKRWGKTKRSRATGRAAQAKKEDFMKKASPRAVGEAFDDSSSQSCGDCSTTDSNTASDDDLKQRHIDLNTSTAYNAKKKNSTRHPALKTLQASYGCTLGGKQNFCIDPNPKNEKSMSESEIYLAVPKTTSERRILYSNAKSDPIILGSSRTVGVYDTNVRQDATRRSSKIPELMKNGYKPAAASNSTSFYSSCPNILVEKHHHRPLTKRLMKKESTMSDAEGINHERMAILLKYLETLNKNPISGNPLSPTELSPKTAPAEKARFAVKSCLDSLQNGTQVSIQPQLNREVKYKSLRDAVDDFINDLNAGLPSISLSQLDSSGMASFLYADLRFHLHVPGGIANGVIIQTWYEDNERATDISTLVAKFNTSLQKIGVDGRLTFRKMNGKHAFSLTKTVDPELFCKNIFRHSIENFVEMSIKVHNIINTDDVKRLEKVRLTNSVAI